MTKMLWMSGIASAALMATFGAAAAAETKSDLALEEIIVTATKAGATRLQDTPLAVTALTGDLIAKAGLNNVKDLMSLTPNLVIAQNGSFSQVYIRGIGSNNVFAGSDPSSTLHVDGVYMARPISYLNNFLDVERVEVLRGPQGTLYGRNSVGGTINVISRLPDDEFRAKLQFTGGNYDLMRAEGYISGPLIEGKLAGSVSLLRSKRNGYLKNIVDTGNDVDNENVWAGRVQLRFTPNERLEFRLRADNLQTDDAGGAYVKLLQLSPTEPIVNTIYGDYGKVALNLKGRSQRRTRGLSGELLYDVTDNMKLSSLTAYRESRLISSSDSDATAANVRRTDQLEDQWQFSQEFNLTGAIDDLSYVLGLYYFREHILANSSVNAFATNTATTPNPTVNTNAWAGYGQGTYHVTDQIAVTAGMRYTRETKDFDQNYSQRSLITGLPLAGYPRLYSLSNTYDAWTPKLGLEFRPVDDVLVYASISRGFKSGGFNFSSANPLQGFDPEKLWSYELGFKTDLLERRLRLNGAAFHYKYTDLQVQSFLTPGVVDITNASDAKIDGVELELVTAPVEGLQIGGHLAYLDAVYKNYPNALKAGNIPFDASGNILNFAPKWSYSIYAQYDQDLNGKGSLFARAEYGWKDRQFFTAENRALESQGSVGLVNASLGYTSPNERWQVLAFGRNLTNKAYLTGTANLGLISGRVGEPRTYGLRLTVDY
ncbi:TonB-dependent receptor [Govanella unica]|uniref:TonB-dependent receptor n=1 Tax=Govanella unica TaxID=2975056 RepID=A0A9X3TZA1_9PROT|nr:TonB-dependent receptor [Govania unica]MDA5194531.1 TonB-dependent receptor [Govania unica]